MGLGLSDLFGILGVGLLMAAYLLLQLNRLNSSSLRYSLFNLVGASLIILSLWSNFNLSAFVIEVFWVLISLIGIIRYFHIQRRERQQSG